MTIWGVQVLCDVPLGCEWGVHVPSPWFRRPRQLIAWKDSSLR